MTRLLFAAALALYTAAPASALPLMPFTDTKSFAEKATDVVIADCLDPDAAPGPKLDGVTVVQVDVLQVLKGERKAGKAKLVTIGQPMERGHRYLMISFGGSVGDIKFLANAELAVVEVPAGFDLKALDGKPLPEQMQLVFDARREQVRLRLVQLEREKVALEKTAPKPPEPAKPNPPEVQFSGEATRGGHRVLAFEVVNPNAGPLPYHGYTADSFEPKPAAGGIYPLHRLELRRGDKWVPKEPGWCKTGVGPVAVAGKGKARFELPIPDGEWDEVRVGVVWFAGGHGMDPQTAWSKGISRKDLTKER